MPKNRKFEIYRDVPGYDGTEGFKSIFNQVNNFEKTPHEPFVFIES